MTFSANILRSIRAATKSNSGRGLAWLMGSSIAGQFLSIIMTPVFSRLYTPSDYGAVAVYSSVSYILLIISALRYEQAVPLPSNEDEGIFALVLSLSLTVISSFLVAVVLWFGGGAVANGLGLGDGHQSLMWMLPVTVLGGGVYQSLNYWAIRKREFPVVARTKVLQSLSSNITQLLFGLLKSGSIGILIAGIIGQTAGVTRLSRSPLFVARITLRQFSLADIWRVAVRYRRFPLISTGSGLVNSLGLQLMPILLAQLYGGETIGLFSMSQRVVAVPMQVIGQAVSQVYFGEVAQLVRDGSGHVGPLFFKTAKRLLGVALIPSLALSIASPLMFGIVFGHVWARAGLYVTILTPLTISQFVVSPLSQITTVLEKQDVQLLGDIIRIILVLLGVLVPHYLNLGTVAVIVCYSTAMSVAYVVYFMLYLHVVKRYSPKPKAISNFSI